MNRQRRRVVVIDDNAHDIELFSIACEEGNIDVEITAYVDGAEAMHQLARAVEEQPSSAPDMLFVDLNMPGVHGLQVIEFMKSHPILRSLPLIVLTTSDSPRDRERCERLGADRYVMKPATFEAFVALLKDMLPNGVP